MALKITLVICATILLLFIIVLLILAYAAHYYEVKVKMNDEKVASLKRELEKEKTRLETKNEEIKRLSDEVHQLRSKHNDYTLSPPSRKSVWK